MSSSQTDREMRRDNLLRGQIDSEYCAASVTRANCEISYREQCKKSREKYSEFEKPKIRDIIIVDSN